MKQKLSLVLNVIFFGFSLTICGFESKELKTATEQMGQYDPLLIVVLMVKNEEHVIRQTLQPFIDAGINSFFIFDTGSTDDTLGVTKRYFQDLGIVRYYITQEPFVDFSTSRNRALRLAEKAFPEAAFIVMPDAEWYLQNPEQLLQFCAECVEEKHDTYDAYLMRIFGKKLDFYTPRLIRCHANVQFTGVVHEILKVTEYGQVPETIFFKYETTRRGDQQSLDRAHRDLRLLEKTYANHPQDPRTLFYLAQTHAALGNIKIAHGLYKDRIKLTGFDEENFIAKYRLALATDVLSQSDARYTWPEALNYYLESYAMRPNRIEPIVRLAEHYLHEEKPILAFMFANFAASLPYPNDVLFVEKEIYTFHRYNILEQAARAIGAFDIGEQALQLAMKARPDAPYLHELIPFYEKIKKGKGVHEAIGSTH